MSLNPDLPTPGAAGEHKRARARPLRARRELSASRAGVGTRGQRLPPRNRHVLLAVLLAWIPGLLAAAPAAPGLTYEVRIASVGDAVIDDAVARASLLATLADDEPVPPAALIARAEADRLRIDDVLRSFGRYDAVIDLQMDAIDSADPALPERLAARAAAPPVRVEVRIDPGPLYRLAGLTLAGAVPEAARSAFALRAGEPAAAGPVLGAGTAMLAALREDGFALARVPPPEAIVDHRTRTMDLRYHVEPGPRVVIGAIEITGLEHLREAFVRRRLGLVPGEPYRPSRLERARLDLVASEAVVSARLLPGTAVDADGRLPIKVALVEGKRRSVRVAGAFASDDGASLLLGWTHRNLFGGAERLSLTAELGTLDGGSRDELDYAAGVSLRLPDRRRRGLDIAFDVGAVSESLAAYDRDALTAGAALEQRLSARLAAGLGLAFEGARIAQDGPPEDVRLFSVPITLAWEGTDAALSPRRGFRLNAELVPVPWLQGAGSPFTRLQVAGAGFLDLGLLGRAARQADAGGAPGSTVIAGRVALGRIVGADAGDVPPNRRLYAGGAASVRGYPYQAIGPRTARGAPAGGDAAAEASLELRRRFAGPWGVVAFADAGSVSAGGLLALDDTRLGVGLGVRFHTVVGPLRADVAVPLDPYPGDAPVLLYLGIGEAF